MVFLTLSNPGCVCVWVGGSVGRRVDVQARVVYVSEWVCVFAVPIYFNFFL